jgi:beta-phosphoglucomutase family hydrolase
MNKSRAFLFDLNGTMINDMEYHIRAWYNILNSLGANISMERMKEECYGKNHELLERIFPNRFSYAEKNKMSFEKEQEYQRGFFPHLELIPGLDEFLRKAYDAKIPIAIGSAAIMFNVDFVLDNLHIRKYFQALVSADDVQHSKPDPETYLKCAEELGMDPKKCIVFEDAPKGVESALNAGMKCVVLTILHKREEFSNHQDILAYVDDFRDSAVLNLIK